MEMALLVANFCGEETTIKILKGRKKIDWFPDIWDVKALGLNGINEYLKQVIQVVTSAALSYKKKLTKENTIFSCKFSPLLQIGAYIIRVTSRWI